ncbi:uncharacterized protein LOC131682627 [Topomyia yanbarensis]|uniref:uncharacterized protein LOC131682627 n=1 Tax=Topomyia yanbarensis TaxID=2498891 RepID=UPI00273BF424|nr:uncharacterized protein LOC131682627 [Topomyia yanbarensis]
MNIIEFILIFSTFFYEPIQCYHTLQTNRRQPADLNDRNFQTTRHRFGEAYYYNTGADYPLEKDGTYYIDTQDQNYESLGVARDRAKENNRLSKSAFDNLSTFSDADFSEALSKLSDRELDKLSLLVDDEERISKSLTKREVEDKMDYTRLRRANCDGELCSSKDLADSSLAETSDNDQIASFKSWFSKGKSTKTTKVPITTARRSANRVTTVRPKNSKKKVPPSRTAARKNTSKLFSDNKDVLTYGNNRETKKAVDRNVHTRINYLKKKIQKRAELSNPQMERSAIRRKREIRRTQMLGESGTSGVLEDSFPEPSQATASFHSPMEPLVRVKRHPS